MVESVYVHIPFCLRKCIYCDFVSVPFDDALSNRYMDALARELSLSTGAKQAGVKTLFVGGGTPTALSAGQLGGLLAALGQALDFHPGAEVTVEANPATLDEGKAGLLFQGGINRISIGAQSFDADELKLLGRVHRPADISDAVKLCRAAGFENLNLDLIYGLPGQKREGWRESLKSALRLGPTHISAYELTVEEGTGLWNLVKSGAINMPPEDKVLAMSEDAEEVLGGAGFIRYEVSNYALPGFECRHNLNYWRRGEYLGMGAAAHSFSGGRRWRNTGGVAEYIDVLEANGLPVAETETLTKDEEKREIVLMGLRTREGVPLSLAGDTGADETGIGLERAARELIGEGLLEIRADRLRATRRGFQILNSVILRLLEGLSL